MRAVIVIPARYASTRFPGKPLARIAGVSLIQRVYQRATRSQRAEAVYVATDDDRIAEHVTAFGGRVLRPEGDFATGTDRIAAAMRLLDEQADLIVNVQGDEPLIDIAEVDALIDLMGVAPPTSAAGFLSAAEVGGATRSPAALPDIGTLACPLTTDEEFLARDVVKVVIAEDGQALYFSRAPIGSRETALRHIGVYAYRRDALERFVSLPPSPLERAESLEQLRGLQHGLKIVVSQTARPHLGVDRPEDVARVESELERLHS